MQKNKICHITTVHSLFDVRIFYKECLTLRDAGFEVYLVVTHYRDEEVNGIKIKALPQHKNRLERIFKKSFIALKRALETKAEIYHFHDPELIPIGIILKLLRKKVIYDVHEDVPAQILSKNYLGNRILKRIFALIFYLIEKICSQIFDSIIGVTFDISSKFPKAKSITIRNFPILKEIDNISPLNVYKEKPIAIYAGGLTRIRGIKEIIEATGYLEGKVELWLLGEWEDENFKKECESIKGWEYTKYIGFIPFGQHYSYIKAVQIGLVNFQPCPNHVKAMPNKPFEYMACGIPIVMSNFPYWEEVFKDCALFANPLDPKDIAEKIDILLNDVELRIKLGRSGRKLIEKEYSWEAESKKLVDLYNKLLEKS